MTWTLEKKAILNGSLVLALFVFIGALQYRTIRDLINSFQWVTHTVEVLQQIEAVQFTIARAEDDAQDYLIAGDRSVVASYQSAVQDSKTGLHRLAGMVSDNPDEQARVASLTPLVDAKFAGLDRVIALRQNGRVAEAESQEFARDGRQHRRCNSLVR
ncbi:MAG: CHASE3 domain-containing protein [Terriglobia bacterium]